MTYYLPRKVKAPADYVKSKLRRRERNYLSKVEAELFGIWRQSKDMTSELADPTPSDMHHIMTSALRALKALGWEHKPT